MRRPLSSPPPGRLRLRLLATSDLHMNLASYDYHADRPDPAVGLVRLATLIRAARAEAERDGALVLLVDNGDGLQGTALADPAAAAPERPHLLMRAFAELGYDAVGLGNHDFDFGLDRLGAALADAPCPVLCSNLRRLGDGVPAAIRRHAILDRAVPGGPALRIGVLSVLPPQTLQWDRDVLHGRVEIDDILDSAAREAAVLRGAGCDLVVALAHSGPGPDRARPGMENAVVPLSAIEGIDAIVAGHTHELLPDPQCRDAEAARLHRRLNRRPVVMPGTAGSHLGVIDLELVAAAQGGWQVAASRAGLRPIARRRPDGRAEPLAAEDPALVRMIAADHQAARAAMRRPVGRSDRPLHSYFTFFAPDRALALVAAAKAAALRPLLAGTDADGLPLLSAAAPRKFGARAGPFHYTNVPAGPLLLRHLADLYPFANELRAAVLTGRQLLDWLEMTASLFRRVEPGSAGAALVDPDVPGHNFDVLHGLEYRIDLSAPRRFRPDGSLCDPASRRIRQARWNGRPLDPDQRFAVALNSYRAAGGGQVAALRDLRLLPVPPVAVRDALARYVGGALPAEPLAGAPPPWRFAPLAGTAVIARTGPEARAHLPELDGRGVSVLGTDRDGFLRLRIPLDRG